MPIQVHIFTFSISLLFLFSNDPSFGQKHQASVPPLSPELILYHAMKNADASRLLDAELLTKDNASLRAKTNMDLSVNGKWTHLDNQNEATSPGPDRIRSDLFQAGTQKTFISGTTLFTEIKQSKNSLDLPIAASPLQLDSYYESSLSVGVRQPLWRNQFGRSLKSQSTIAEKTDQNVILNYQADKEQLATTFIDQYFQAWLAQAQWESAKDLLDRQKKLLQVVHVKERRGTAEPSEVLQIQSAVIMAEQSLLDFHKALEDIWIGVALSLKLPEEYLKTDPTKLTLKTSNAFVEAKALCLAHKQRSEEEKRKYYANAPKSKALQQNIESSLLQAESQRDAMLPDLYVESRVSANGIDESFGKAASESASLKNPLWSIALGIEWNLGAYDKKAAAIEAHKQKVKSEILMDQFSTLRNIEWHTQCENLGRLQEKNIALKEVYQNQSRRSRLESERFRHAGIDVYNVIQAESDVINAILAAKRTEAQLQTTSWKIKTLNHDLVPMEQKQ